LYQKIIFGQKATPISWKMNNSCTSGNLQSFKNKAWSSLQHLMVDTSEESDEGDLATISNGNHCSSPLTNGELSRSATLVFAGSSSDTMKLKREDMRLFGQRPAWDPFYLVVCEYCDQVIKPQALRRHIELRHNLPKASSLQTPATRPQSGRSQSNSTNASVSPTFTAQSGCAFVTATEPNQNSNSASNSQPASTVSSASNTGDSSLSNGVAATFTATGESNLKTLLSTPTVSIYSPHNDSQTRFDLDPSKVALPNTKPTVKSSNARSNATNSAFAGPSTATEPISNEPVAKKFLQRTKLLPCKDRKYDADRHCGVRSAEQDAPCTRSLTCKTHSLTLRRAVVGRSDLFDTLLNQHRLEKEAAMRAAGLEVKPTKQQLKQQQKLQKEMLSSTVKTNRSKPSTSNDSSPISMSPASNSAPPTPARSQLLAQLQSPIASSVCSPSLVISPVKHSARQPLPHSSSAASPVMSGSIASQMPTSNVYGQPMHSSMATAIGLPIVSKTSDSNVPTAHCNKILLQKLSGKLNDRAAAVAAAAASAAQQQQNCAPDLLFGVEASRYDSTDHLTARQQEQLLLIGCQPRPAAVCTFNARQLRIEAPGNYSPSSGSILSSRLFDRKRDFTYSALAVFRSPSNVKSGALSGNDEVIIQSDSLHSNSNHSSSDLGNSNSASLHSSAGTADKCFVNMFTNPVPATNLFSNM
jgi:hypothetical protein